MAYSPPSHTSVYSCSCSLLVSHGVLPIPIRCYSCSYSLENYVKMGSTARISGGIPTILPDSGRLSRSLASLANATACLRTWRLMRHGSSHCAQQTQQPGPQLIPSINTWVKPAAGMQYPIQISTSMIQLPYQARLDSNSILYERLAS